MKGLYDGTEASLKSIHYNVGEAGSLFFVYFIFYGIIDNGWKWWKKLVLHDEQNNNFLGGILVC